MGKIKGFDGLRGISVLLVIINHGEIFQKLGIESSYFATIASGGFGVTIFFVLSGFLITFLLIKEMELYGTINLKKFYIRRFLRIMPLYFLVITGVLLLQSFNLASARLCSYLYAYSYLTNFIPKQCSYSAFSHFWSLAVEEHFYLVWPFIFCLGKRWGIFMLSTIIVFSLYYDVVPFVSFSESYQVNHWTLPAATPIMFGCLTAYLARNKYFIKKVQSGIIKNLIFTLGVFIILIKPLYSSQFFMLTAICCVMVYIYLAQDSILVRLLETQPLAYLGLISYGLYVWQGILTGNGPYRTGGYFFPIPLEYGLILTFIVAPLSYHIFEKPFLRFKAKFEVKEYTLNDIQDNEKLTEAGIKC